MTLVVFLRTWPPPPAVVSREASAVPPDVRALAAELILMTIPV
jgi:hypothetical protein